MVLLNFGKNLKHFVQEIVVFHQNRGFDFQIFKDSRSLLLKKDLCDKKLLLTKQVKSFHKNLKITAKKLMNKRKSIYLSVDGAAKILVKLK